MSDGRNAELEIFRLYVGTAEAVSGRRAAANTWMLSVNAAIVSVYGLLASTGSAPAASQAAHLTAAATLIPIAGLATCASWFFLLKSYAKLNGAKFRVIRGLEERLQISLFSTEEIEYNQMGRRSFGSIERFVPIIFAGLHIAALGLTLL